MLACRDEDYALALVDGAFTKALVVQLVRKVEGKQFFDVRAQISVSHTCSEDSHSGSHMGGLSISLQQSPSSLHESLCCCGHAGH